MTRTTILRNGASTPNLPGVVHESITRVLNGHDSARISFDATDVDAATLTSLKLADIELRREGWAFPLIRGRLTDLSYGDGRISGTVMGPTWMLSRRRVGPIGGPTNRLANGSFESGHTGWSFALTVSPFTYTTFTQADERNNATPTARVTLRAADDGSLSLRLKGNTDTADYGDLFGWQEVTVSGGVRGVTATLKGRILVPSTSFVRYPAFNRGFMLAVFPTTFTQTGANGGKTGWFFDMEEWRSTVVDEKTRKDTWYRDEVSITIPAGTTKVLHARLCSPNGIIQYDDVVLEFDDALEFHQVPVNDIIEGIIDHSRDPTYGKTAYELDIINWSGVPFPSRDLVALHSNKQDCWSLIEGFIRLDAGVDMRTTYASAQTAEMEIAHPLIGSLRAHLPLWSDGSVLSLESWEFAGSRAANAVSVQAENAGTRDWAGATSASAFADSQVYEEVVSAEIEVNRNDLVAAATEALATLVDPTSFVVRIRPEDIDAYLEYHAGDWAPCNIKAGSLRIVGTYRVLELILTEEDDGEGLYLRMGRAA